MAIKEKTEKQENKQEKKSEAAPSAKPVAASSPQGPQDPGGGGSPAEPGEPIAKNPKVASVASWIVWIVAILIGIVFFWKMVGGGDSQVVVQPVAPVFQQPAPVQEVVYSVQKAEVVRGGPKKDTFIIHLLGDDRWSEEVFDTRLAPPGVACYYEGPETAMVRLSDGTTGPITGWYGVKGGKTRFKGPAGEVVTVKCGDHDEEPAETEERLNGQDRGYPQQDPREVFPR